jgi:hypothetical protein
MVCYALLTRYGMKSVKTGSKRRPVKVSPKIVELLEESAKNDLIVTHPYNEFLSQWDETYPPHVVQRIAEVLAKGQRDRRYSWSASAAGTCLRRQEFQFLGMPAVVEYNPQQKRIYLNGTWVHLRTQATMMSAEILDNIEVTHKKMRKRARATLDGMGTAKQGRYDGADFGWELKSANEYAYQHQMVRGVSEKVRKQVDFEFLMTGFDLFVIFNENKNNQDIHEWVIVRDESRVREMAEQVDALNYAIDRGRLHSQLPECRKKLRSGEFYKCPYGGDGGVCASVGTWPREIP